MIFDMIEEVITSGLDGDVLPIGEHILIIDAGGKDVQAGINLVGGSFKAFTKRYERAAYEGIVVVENDRDR